MNEPTVITWLIGLLSLLLVTAILVTLKAWRDAKRSPFFFLRLQAQKRMQSGAMASIVLAVLTLGVGTYLQQQEPPATARFALITAAKPVEAATTEESTPDIAVAFQADSAPPTATVPNDDEEVFLEESGPLTQIPRELPPEFDQYESEIALQSDTDLGAVAFSTSIDDAFEAVDPQRIFEEGRYTVYATFSYDGMVDGMVWSWVWRYNGEVIGGGNEVWSYGGDGPGYIFLKPEGGFIPGEYDLQVWVNDELLTTNRFFVTGTVTANQ